MPVKHAPETRLPWGTWVGGKKCIYSCAIGSPKHYGTQYLREVMHGTYSVVDVPRERDL